MTAINTTQGFEGMPRDGKRSVRELHLKRKKLWDASIGNHEKYLNPDNGLFKNEFTESRDCPACGNKNYKILFFKSGGRYVSCNECEMLYLNPVFKDFHLSEYYKNNHSLQSEVVEDDYEFYKNLYSQGLGLIHKSSAPKGLLLDVGCSSGIFLDIARESGWQTFGLELNRGEAEVSRIKGHSIKEEMVDTANFGCKFDVVTLWDVFEHIKDGQKFLSKIKSQLNEGAIVFIQSPTRDSLAARILQASCNMFDGLEHVNLYGYKSFDRIAKSSGFEILEYETVISEIGVIENYLNYEDPYLGCSRNPDLVKDLMAEEEILNKRLGYKFQACLRMR